MPEHSIRIVERLNKARPEIEAWFKTKFQTRQPPFYSSVDLRHSAFKLAPIDVNLYPAGFNNLAPQDEAFAIIQAKNLIHQRDTSYKKILIITENHTRNLYYLEHLAKLKSILMRAGFTVKLSMLNTEAQVVDTLSNKKLSFETVTKRSDYLHIEDFIPDCIILNNDLSEGFPELFANIRQPILPAPTLGWYQRKKSHYFQKYNEVCQDFAHTFELDDWFINPLFTFCDDVNFTKVSDQTTLFETAQNLLNKITEKYQYYGISQNPYLIIKADSGSYGMGVLAIENAEEITHLSRKHRQHMAKTKGNRPIQSVILQEGVPTFTKWNQSVAEPVIYLMGEKTIGGFYRAHTTRSAKENLNTPGMQLTPFALHQAHEKAQDELFYAYQVVARLATLAAAFEIEAVDPKER